MSERWDHTNDEKCYGMWKSQEARAQRAEIELLHTKKDLAAEKARAEKAEVEKKLMHENNLAQSGAQIRNIKKLEQEHDELRDELAAEKARADKAREDRNEAQDRLLIYRIALEKIVRVNAMDYEYVEFAKEALKKTEES